MQHVEGLAGCFMMMKLPERQHPDLEAWTFTSYAYRFEELL